MTGTEWLAVAAVILSAIAILPGTLGILMLTNKIAASAPGARWIYGRSFWILVLSGVIMAVAAYQALAAGTASWVFLGAVAAYAGILVFGFFMHTRLLFRPVRKPMFLSVDEAIEKFGPDEEVVGVIDDTGTPYAFVARLARRPHIVYQPDGEAPFLMTHCILAHSSMAYAMEGQFKQPDIMITAALANNMVFYEKSNQCSVIQLHNRSRGGELPLRTLPTVAVSLATWKKLYPDSRVWHRNIEWRDIFYLKLLARADVIDPKSPVMVYPLQHGLDERLPMKSMVIGVQIGDQTRTYPASLFENGAHQLIHDELGGTPLLLAAACDGDYIQVFDRRLDDGQVLTFRPAETADHFVDNETGSEWAPTGNCMAGPLEGKRLKPVPHYNKIFWYVWSDFHPGTEIYQPAPAGEARAAAPAA